MIATITITLNNQVVTIRPSQIIEKFLHYNFDQETQKGSISSTWVYPDQANVYEVMTEHITSEFADYQDSVDHISQHSIHIEYALNPSLASL